MTPVASVLHPRISFLSHRIQICTMKPDSAFRTRATWTTKYALAQHFFSRRRRPDRDHKPPETRSSSSSSGSSRRIGFPFPFCVRITVGKWQCWPLSNGAERRGENNDEIIGGLAVAAAAAAAAAAIASALGESKIAGKREKNAKVRERRLAKLRLPLFGRRERDWKQTTVSPN